MFKKKVLPKIYCKITIHNEYDSAVIDFYGLLAYKTLNRFSEITKGKGLRKFNDCEYIELDTIYHFLANENFIPVSETFFYREMETRDQLSES